MAATYRIPVIEDDVYLELGHGRITPLPAKHWDKEGYILWCGSVSKTLTAGYRLGGCLPGRYFDRYLQQRNTQSFGVSSPIQLALADFINSGQYRTHLRKIRLALARQCLLQPVATTTAGLCQNQCSDGRYGALGASTGARYRTAVSANPATTDRYSCRLTV